MSFFIFLSNNWNFGFSKQVAMQLVAWTSGLAQSTGGGRPGLAW